MVVPRKTFKRVTKRGLVEKGGTRRRQSISLVMGVRFGGEGRGLWSWGGGGGGGKCIVMGKKRCILRTRDSRSWGGKQM